MNSDDDSFPVDHCITGCMIMGKKKKQKRVVLGEVWKIKRGRNYCKQVFLFREIVSESCVH